MQALMPWGCEEVQKLFLSLPWQKNKMEHSQEQQYVIKFCFHLGKTAWERHALVKEAYIRDALSKARVFWSFSELKNWQKTIADMKQSGHPSWRGLDENVAKVNFWDCQPSFECQINHRRCQYVWNNGSQKFARHWCQGVKWWTKIQQAVTQPLKDVTAAEFQNPLLCGNLMGSPVSTPRKTAFTI